MSIKKNIDLPTSKSFGEEWEKFNQDELSLEEAKRRFDEYFHIFPWKNLPPNAEGVDIGCGSGRWDKFVAPKVGKLHCVEPAEKALNVAKRNLSEFHNIEFHHCSLNSLMLPFESQDFCFSLGVLHHMPNTIMGLERCTKLLKPGAPILIYLYYKFDNRSKWFKLAWKTSNIFRKLIIKLPSKFKNLICELFAFSIYLPLAKTSWLLEKLSLNVDSFPLSYYRNCSFYTMRTDARDRFGTPVEHRFSKLEIIEMCKKVGLEDVTFSARPPYWCFTANKKL